MKTIISELLKRVLSHLFWILEVIFIQGSSVLVLTHLGNAFDNSCNGKKPIGCWKSFCCLRKGHSSIKYSRSGRYILLLCFVNAQNRSLLRWKMRDEGKSTKLIMLKLVLQKHAWKNHGCILEKVCVSSHLYAKTVEAESQELWVTEIICIFLFSLMVSLILSEREILQGWNYSQIFWGPGLVCFASVCHGPYLSMQMSMTYLRDGNTSSSLALSAVFSLLHLAWLFPLNFLWIPWN